jgi:hypothetical protein
MKVKNGTPNAPLQPLPLVLVTGRIFLRISGRLLHKINPIYGFGQETISTVTVTI